MINDTLAIYEAVYLLIAVPGLFMTLINLYDAWTDLRLNIKRKVTRARILVAWRDVRGEIGRALVFILVIVVATRAATTPNRPLDGIALLISTLYYVLLLWKVGGAFLDRRTRVEVRNTLNRIPQNPNEPIPE
jgi:hypothetical protein